MALSHLRLQIQYTERRQLFHQHTNAQYNQTMLHLHAHLKNNRKAMKPAFTSCVCLSVYLHLKNCKLQVFTFKICIIHFPAQMWERLLKKM